MRHWADRVRGIVPEKVAGKARTPEKEKRRKHGLGLLSFRFVPSRSLWGCVRKHPKRNIISKRLKTLERRA